MKAFDYYQKYQRQVAGSTIATRTATAQDISQAKRDAGIDWHADQRTDAQ